MLQIDRIGVPELGEQLIEEHAFLRSRAEQGFQRLFELLPVRHQPQCCGMQGILGFLNADIKPVRSHVLRECNDAFTKAARLERLDLHGVEGTDSVIC